MAERKTYTAEDFRGCNGREVLVRGVIYDEAPETYGAMGIEFPCQLGTNVLTIRHSAIVEILPEEIGIGDLVRMPGGSEVTVKAIVDDGVRVALLKYNDGHYDARPLSDLTLVERGQ